MSLLEIKYINIRNMNRNKKTVRLTESELRNFIKEAVATVLRENNAINGVTEEEVLNIIHATIEGEKNNIHNIELNDYEVTQVKENNKYHYNEFGANLL